MTCIIGVIEDNKVYIGGDSASIAGYNQVRRNDKKVFSKMSVDGVEYIFGGAGSFRMIQLLQYSVNIPKNTKDSIFEFMCTDFINTVRSVFKENGYTTITSNNEKCDKFLVGVGSDLFAVDEDFQVVHSNLHSIGAGNSFALGAFKALENSQFPIEEKIKKSLEISEHFNIGVVSPFYIIHT